MASTSKLTVDNVVLSQSLVVPILDSTPADGVDGELVFDQDRVKFFSNGAWYHIRDSSKIDGSSPAKALARSMANTKQVKAAAVLNNAFNAANAGGDGKELCATDHPTVAGSFSNELATSADLNETSLEQSMIDIAAMTDERGLRIAARGVKMIIPSELQFTAERLMKTQGRTGTADNDINAIVSMGMIPQGYRVKSTIFGDRTYGLQAIAHESPSKT